MNEQGTTIWSLFFRERDVDTTKLCFDLDSWYFKKNVLFEFDLKFENICRLGCVVVGSRRQNMLQGGTIFKLFYKMIIDLSNINRSIRKNKRKKKKQKIKNKWVTRTHSRWGPPCSHSMLLPRGMVLQISTEINIH